MILNPPAPDGAKYKDPLTIWKYDLKITDTQVVPIPCAHKFLAAQSQGTNLVAWYLVNPKNPKVNVQFSVVGTGHPITKDPGTYMGTAQQYDGRLVWHVFTRVV